MIEPLLPSSVWPPAFAARSMMRLVLGVFLIAPLVACADSRVTDGGISSVPIDTATPPTGTVQRARLEVRLAIAPEDTGFANQAGLSLPGTRVRLQRLASPDAERSAVIAPNGIAQFDSLLEGTYAIGADRLLTAEETARLLPDQREATVFAGGMHVTVRPPVAANATLSLVAARRGSVVISEVFAYSPGPPIFYGLGHYLEVYNNSDTTVFLDGLLVFMTLSQMHTDVWGACQGTDALHAPTNADWRGTLHH